MAICKTQAWVTSVLKDDSVPSALVLAESLRRSLTTRRIIVITSPFVSMETRVVLEKSFDLVFTLDDMYMASKVTQCDENGVIAKAYVFALIPFEKCVFISANSMVLENADKLFESNRGFASRLNHVNGSLDLSVFMVQPERGLWQQILTGVDRNKTDMTENYLGNWLKNQRAAISMEILADSMIADFSITAGKMMGAGIPAPIIHLVDGPNNQKTIMHDQIKLLNSMTVMGILGKNITDLWIDLYRKAVSKLQLDIGNAWPATQDEYRNEPVAIVGMSCRFPGANSVGEFWNMLYEGEEGICEPPAFRWIKEHTMRLTQQDRKSQAGFLATTVDEFDARFFGVSPKEAAYMDPQTRLLHEVLWESMEDAGINPLGMYGTHAGIFTGSWMNDYKDIVAGSVEKDFFRTYMGNSIGAAAARLSFLLGLTGPSIATESGCSSAIVAVDLAVKSLRNGETNLALAGGVNLLLHPFNSSMMEYVISPDGRCKTFDAKANGFGRAEGCGVLVLKRLSDALRDRDNIWAIIRGSAVAQEGVSRSLGTPTVHCESLAMKLALKDANVKPERVSFVETHGTGTQVGDPMEVAAIARAYHSRNRKEPLVIGSVKTNVGHTESCSGITGIMKAVLAMQHEIIPKHRNLETLNPEIFLDSIPAIIPMENLPWAKVAGQPRLCGVSSFGITGTDGHVILEEAPENSLPKFSLGLERPTHLMTISGKTSEALDELLREYENRFSGKDAENAPAKELADMAYTGNVGRAAFNHRTFVIASNFANAAKMLKEKQLLQVEVKDGHNPQVCMLFTGQGSQHQGMAKSLYETSPVFRIHFDHCDRELRASYEIFIKKALWESEAGSKELSRTIYSQTSIFCVEYCLLRLWQSWGVQPDYVLGHSLGEFCAAVAAGILEFEDALKLVAERSRLIDNLPRGSMLVIKASQPEVEKLMKDKKIGLDFAAVNNPEQTVVAGDTKTVEEFLAYVKSQNVKAIILEATHAFHSRHMDPMLEQYRTVAQTINFKRGNSNVQYVSGMEGRVIEHGSEMGADYWVRHTREKVSFIEACAALKESGCTDFLEVGPHPVLSSFVMMNNAGVSLNCLPSLRRGQGDWETILTSLGKLYLLGYSIDWKAYDEPYIRRKVPLPFHPFHRKPFWVECVQDNAAMIHPLVGGALKNASSLNIFQNDLTLKAVPYLKDHCIGSRIVFPGAGYTEMCLSAGYCVANGITDVFEQPTRPMRLENVRIDAPLELKEGKSCRLQVIVDLPEKTEKQEDVSGFRVKVFHQNANNSEESGKWVLHASSTFHPVASTKECLSRWDPTQIQDILRTVTPTAPDSFYKRVDEQGLKFGESFLSIRRIWTKKQPDCKEDMDEVVTEVALPSDWNKYLLHPLIIDACFQTGILTRYNYESSKLKVPVRIGQLTLFSGVSATPPELDTLYIHVRTTEHGIRHLFICTPTLTPVASVDDVELLDTNVRTIESVLEQQSSAVPDAWEESWKVIPSPFQSSLEHSAQLELVSGAPYLLTDKRKAEMEHQYRQTRRLLYLYIVGALQELGWEPELGSRVTPTSLQVQLRIQPKFLPLLRFYLRQIEEEGEILTVARDEEHTNSWRLARAPPTRQAVQREAKGLADALKDTPVALSTILIYEHLAQSLAKILRGEVSALQLLFPQEEEKQQYSAETYYIEHPGAEETWHVVESFTKALYQHIHQRNGEDHPKKVFRVLEVGAGTGSMSMRMLKVLRNVWADRFEYYYTDISQSFFIKAETRLEAYRDNIKFQVFNLELSPLSQGIPVEYFDGVCCTDVLHATRDLEESLTHLRQTLKPGGFLLFTETIIPARDITFVFGLLEGYWRFEDKQWRPEHCCVSERAWAQVLEKTGFGKVSAVKSYMDQFACITATAEESSWAGADSVDSLTTLSSTQEGKGQPEWLVLTDAADVPHIATRLAGVLRASGFQVTLVLREEEEEGCRLGTSHNNNASIGRVRAEEEAEVKKVLVGSSPHGIIYAWGLRRREQDQSKVALPLLNLAKGLVSLMRPPQLFVLTQGVAPVTEDLVTENPSAATLSGMLKSLKNETSNMFVRAVDLESASPAEEMVAQVLFEVAMTRTPKEAQRIQVAYRGGLRYEPKLLKANLNTASDALKLPPGTDRYQLKLPASRVIQDLEFIPDEAVPLTPTEVEVKVKAYALNFRDIFTILKPSKEFENLNAVGLDFSGVVTRLGADAKWKVGERVFGANFRDDQLPSYLVVDTESAIVMRYPDSMTDWEAACLPAVYSTAYHCLITRAGMRKGDTVLIHTGSGGVGLAAIQLAKTVGATIITTAGNPRKRAYLRNLGIQHVFHSRDTSFEQDVLLVTQGRGVDIVLNSITGPGVKEATLRATARSGRFIEMSKLNTWSVEQVKQLRPDVYYDIVDLTVIDLASMKNLVDRLHEYLDQDLLKPIPYVRFDALHIRKALQYFQQAKHIGKVVATLPEIKTEKGQFITQCLLFNGESTYLITGGLGGIGFEVCKWMLVRGATDIVLMGRNPPKPEIEDHISKLNKRGANVMVRLGDVARFDQVKLITDEISQNMKPLRGLMHCAGVLRDNLYSNQTWPDFEATYAPKVQGTWNLHELTRGCRLEHFVTYSSVTALVGTPGQANHASANCFEDAFIHYRHSLGLPGTTINWGQWAQVGCAKEVNMTGVTPVSVQRMLNGLEVTLRSPRRQISFCEFDSFLNFSIFCPSVRHYLDERLWKQVSSGAASSHTNVSADQFWKEMDSAPTQPEKMGVMSGYLKAILRTALRLDPNEQIGEDANIQELGVDSLMMLELKNSIQTLLGSRLTVTANELKDCNTIRLLANAVVSRLVEDADEEQVVPSEPLSSAELRDLLRQDAILHDSVTPELNPQKPVKPSHIKMVLVTGATGQVAPYLVAELSKAYPSVEKIYCLVRATDEMVAKERLKAVLASLQLAQEKVEAVTTENVAQERMGISPDKYEQLVASVDAVIHCAAKVNVLEHFRAPGNTKMTDIRSVNIGGTVNVLRFASTGKIKHVFYPSTLVSGIFGENVSGRLDDSWPETGLIDTIVSNKFPGLQSSKWICEMLLRQANERGIPCKIFRLPWVGGDSQTGRVDPLKNLYVLRYLSFLKMGAMPATVIPANVLPVDLLAKLTTSLFMSDETPHEIFNLAHPHPQVEQEFVSVAQQEFGKMVEIMEPEQLEQRLKAQNAELAAVEKSAEQDALEIFSKNQKMFSTYLGDAAEVVTGYVTAPETFFQNEKVTRYLVKYGANFPSTMDVVRKDLKYLKDTGVLDKFGI